MREPITRREAALRTVAIAALSGLAVVHLPRQQLELAGEIDRRTGSPIEAANISGARADGADHRPRAVAVDEEQDDFAAGAGVGFDALHHVVRGADRLVVNRDDNIAGLAVLADDPRGLGPRRGGGPGQERLVSAAV